MKPSDMSLLVLLSQKVAAKGEANHLFGKIHGSAMGRLKWICQDRTMVTRGFWPMSRGMAAITAPERTAAQHQSLLHFVGEGKWSDGKVLAKVRELVLPKMERHGQIEAWIIDDTGFPNPLLRRASIRSE